MGGEGFWDDQENAAKVNAEYARGTRKLEEFDAVSSEVEDLRSLAEMALEDESMGDELEEQLADLEKRMSVLEEAAPLHRRIRLRRCRGHDPGRRRRDRRPGLGRDGAAHADPLGRESRASRSS